MSTWRVEVSSRTEELDVHGREVLADIHRLGFEHVRAVRSHRLYFLLGRLDDAAVDSAAHDLLCDPVSETCLCIPDPAEAAGRVARSSGLPAHRHRVGPCRGGRDIDHGQGSIFADGSGTVPPTEVGVVEVHYRPGVMDPVALSTRRAVNELLAAGPLTSAGHVDAVRTAWRYTIEGAQGATDLERIAREVLANDCIETVYVLREGEAPAEPVVRSARQEPRPLIAPPAAIPPPPEQPCAPRTIPIRDLDGPTLDRLSRQAHLFLARREMETIRDHFRELGRDPTDLELETFAQTWSEHCVHKTINSEVIYRGEDFGKEGHVEVHFDNLLRSTILRATRELDLDWCLSVFEDNAGVIAFDEEYALAFKVETHNHPSALAPYGGAATGLGGCIRDILGCGLGAKPIATTDVFCVAPPDYPSERLPRGVLHPIRVLKGVVAGVRDYGNRMGIPTVNGAVVFDERYLANPLVFCGCVGLVPRDRIRKEAKPGDRIVLLGGRTGRDGIHGATFSSAELTEDHAAEFSYAVQIGNPIEQKKVLDALLQARDHASGCLYNAITDCGAGGLSSAVGEMGAKLGAVVDLECVPLKYAGLRYDEIWISEAQERMILAVPPERLDALLALCAAEDVEASVIGAFTGDGRLVVRHQGTVVGDLDMTFLHEGLPRTAREATWSGRQHEGGLSPSECMLSGGGRGSAPPSPDTHPSEKGTVSLAELLLDHLTSPNVTSKEWLIRQYDHEVQGGSVMKPLCGPGNGPSDAAVLRPRLDGWRGLALGCGICPHLSDWDPYWMAIRAVDEALRNVICVGADPHQVAILDNFCWGACDTPEALGALVRACVGACHAAVAYGLPYISGKDSLNNQFSLSPAEAQRLGLPRTLSIPGTLLISAIGVVEDVRRCITMDLKQPGRPLALVAAPVQRVGLQPAALVHRRVSKEIRSGEILSAHDVSDGGWAVALAEMCLAGGLGAHLELEAIPGEDLIYTLFGEYATSYVLECASEEEVRRADGVKLGTVTEEPRLLIRSGGGALIDLDLAELTSAWHRGPR